MYFTVGVLVILGFLIYNLIGEKNKVEQEGGHKLDFSEGRPVSNDTNYLGAKITLGAFVFALMLSMAGC